jgi:hypothetical protein
MMADYADTCCEGAFQIILSNFKKAVACETVYCDNGSSDVQRDAEIRCNLSPLTLMKSWDSADFGSQAGG